MPRRLRILQVFNRYLQYGGEEGCVYQIGDALREIHDVELFTSSSADAVRSRFMRWSAAFHAIYNRKVDLQLRHYQNTGHFDAWEIHNIFPVMSPIVYSRAMEWNIPIVHYLHNYRLSCVNGFFVNHGEPCQRCLDGNFWPAFATKCWHESHAQSGLMGLITHHIRHMGLFEKAFQWIAISEAQKREHVRMGIPEERIAVVHHFLDVKSPPPPTPPANKPTAIFIGRLSREKGVAQLLKAWKLVAGGERRLLIIGDGPERANLEAQAADLPGVSFLGFVQPEDHGPIWDAAHFSLVPSMWLEPFGMTVLESWAKARPVIAHRIGGLPELIDENVTGLLAEPSDFHQLAERMEQLFSAPEKTAAMGNAGYAGLETRFSRERWLAQVAKIYDKLL